MNTQIAEWILQLVLPPDRVASTVGDWLEEVPQRGSFWFWSCVFRTVLARIWNDLSASPFTMIRLGFSGFLRNILVTLGFMGAIFVLLSWPYHGDIRYRHDWIWNMLIVNHAKFPAPPQNDLTWQVQALWWILYTAWMVQTARWIMRRAPRRELAACLSIVLVGWVVMILPHWLHFSNLSINWRWVDIIGIAHDLILCTAVVAFKHRLFPEPSPVS